MGEQRVHRRGRTMKKITNRVSESGFLKIIGYFVRQGVLFLGFYSQALTYYLSPFRGDSKWWGQEKGEMGETA